MYFLGFLVLLLANPSRFLPIRIRISYYVCVAMTLFSLISLVGQLVFNIVSWTSGVPDCGKLIDIFSLIGWERLSDLSVMSKLQHVMPDLIVFFTSVYLCYMFAKDMIFPEVRSLALPLACLTQSPSLSLLLLLTSELLCPSSTNQTIVPSTSLSAHQPPHRLHPAAPRFLLLCWRVVLFRLLLCIFLWFYVFSVPCSHGCR